MLTVKQKQADNSREFSSLTEHLSYSDIYEIHLNLIDQAHIFSLVELRTKLFFSIHKCIWPLETITHCTKTAICGDFSQCCQLDFLEKHIFTQGKKEGSKQFCSLSLSLAVSLLRCQHSLVMFPALSLGKIKLALISHNNHSCKPLQTYRSATEMGAFCSANDGLWEVTFLECKIPFLSQRSWIRNETRINPP